MQAEPSEAAYELCVTFSEIALSFSSVDMLNFAKVSHQDGVSTTSPTSSCSNSDHQLQMASTNRKEKNLLSLPREVRERIVGIAIETREGNTIFDVTERDARHLKE